MGNSHVEYTSRECKHDIKESEGNMFNPISIYNYHDENQDEIQYYHGNSKRST